MYIFETTEQNNAKANDFETKSLLYLMSFKSDSTDIDSFFVDCFNDITGVSNDLLKTLGCSIQKCCLTDTKNYWETFDNIISKFYITT